MSEAYSSLEKAQEDFVLVVDEETLEAEGAYLDNPSSVLAEMDLKFSKASDTQYQLKKDVENRQMEEQEKAARERIYAVSLAKFKSSIVGFGKPSGQFTTLSVAKRISIRNIPKFSGDKKAPFLQYPIWKKQWNSHISEYETKYRATKFLNHLNSKGTDQSVGFETEYDHAMEKLDHYYNDSKKIVKACLDKIRGQWSR